MASMMQTRPNRGRAELRLRYGSELWRQYLAQTPPGPLDRHLAVALRQYPQLGSRDRRAYRELLFAAARFGYLAAFVDYVHRRHGLEQAAALPALVAGFAQEAGSVEAAWDAVRAVPADWLLQTVGQRYQREGGAEWPLQGLEPLPEAAAIERLLDELQRSELIEARLLWQGIPLCFAAPLAERAARSGWSAEAREAFLQAQARQPPLWLRLNRPERQQQVLQELAAHGLEAQACGEAIAVRGAGSIVTLPCYRDGLVEIQDWASQQIGLAVAARPGEQVWDACAGAGGKSVQLAVMLAGEGELHASDVRRHKLAEARRRVHRAGFANLRLFAWDGRETETPAQEFDRVLVDAPCSSSGVWRRSPDARFRATQASLARFASLQPRLLCQAAAAVRPGGRLVYSTCSWLVAENEAVVEQFLVRRPEFRLLDWRLHGCPGVDADTMFSAVLERQG